MRGSRRNQEVLVWGAGAVTVVGLALGLLLAAAGGTGASRSRTPPRSTPTSNNFARTYVTSLPNVVMVIGLVGFPGSFLKHPDQVIVTGAPPHRQTLLVFRHGRVTLEIPAWHLQRTQDGLMVAEDGMVSAPFYVTPEQWAALPATANVSISCTGFETVSFTNLPVYRNGVVDLPNVTMRFMTPLLEGPPAGRPLKEALSPSPHRGLKPPENVAIIDTCRLWEGMKRRSWWN